MTSNRRKGEIKRSQFWNKWNTSFSPEGSIGVSTGDLAADPVQSSLLAEFQCFVVCDVMAIYYWTIRAIWYEFSKRKGWDQHFNSYLINITGMSREIDCQCVDNNTTVDWLHWPSPQQKLSRNYKRKFGREYVSICYFNWYFSIDI